MTSAFVDYFRCPESFARFDSPRDLSGESGYFRFGDSICYGRLAGATPARHSCGDLPMVRAEGSGDRLRLPFDFCEVVTNLREERYRQRHRGGSLQRLTGTAVARSLYYVMRPLMSVPVRKHLQRMRLSGWKQVPFPHWPVDVTIETLMQETARLILTTNGGRRLPFVWFWPNGAPSCTIVTHDVEENTGIEFCTELMDLDDSFGVKSAFQLVPETRGDTRSQLPELIRRRGFEVNLHDLNHDGNLFRSHSEFLTRAAQINRYARELRCDGFRSGSMYREQQWFEALDFSYDMSVPNVAHLEAQGGGCCTVMPYFVGDILELPLTTTQDYSLFHILDDYSVDLWKQQMDVILGRNGLISFIAHPDYLVDARARLVYRELLAWLSDLRQAGSTWIALPSEVNRWWRLRCAMNVVQDGDSWRVEGPGSETARLAYVVLDGDRARYELA